MDPWLVRPIAESGDPCTHALVVGVSRYDYLPQTPDRTDEQGLGLAQATTPASSAMRFAEWLRDEYNQPEAPLGTIRLLLSVSDAEKQANAAIGAVEAEVPAPTAANVEEALTRWWHDSVTNRRHVTVLYISGHGIQTSKEGSIILLQDFKHPDDGPRLLRRAIDLQGVREGMSRGDAARRQFYFIDSCRIRPDLLKDYYAVNPGVTIDVAAEGAADVSAVHFGASSGTAALGDPAKGTLFGCALLDCLRGEAYTPTHDGWVVTQASLIAKLQSRVEELARRYDAEQKVTAGGEFIDTVFHVVKEQPRVTLTVRLEPTAAAPNATAELYDDVADNFLFQKAYFRPDLIEDVPPGVFLLAVTIDPPNDLYRNRTVAVIAEPPRAQKAVSVTR